MNTRQTLQRKREELAAPFMPLLKARGFRRIKSGTSGGWPEGRTVRLFTSTDHDLLKMFICLKTDDVHFMYTPEPKQDRRTTWPGALRTAIGTKGWQNVLHELEGILECVKAVEGKS